VPVRLTLFAKGNADLRDPLYALLVGGETLWNGVNQVLRDAGREGSIRVRHETNTCFAALDSASGTPPDEVAGLGKVLGPFSPQAQFSNALFAPGHAAIALSIQGDLTVQMARHRQQGYLLHPYEWSLWPHAQRDWLRANFDPLPASTPEQTMAHLARIVGRVREYSEAPILVFNVSGVTPGETIHCYQGMAKVFSQRVRQFNAALVEASAELGFSIVDVERIVAEHGARQVKIDPIHLNALGCRLVAEEVVRILDDHGLLSEVA